MAGRTPMWRRRALAWIAMVVITAAASGCTSPESASKSGPTWDSGFYYASVARARFAQEIAEEIRAPFGHGRAFSERKVTLPDPEADALHKSLVAVGNLINERPMRRATPDAVSLYNTAGETIQRSYDYMISRGMVGAIERVGGRQKPGDPRAAFRLPPWDFSSP